MPNPFTLQKYFDHILKTVYYFCLFSIMPIYKMKSHFWSCSKIYDRIQISILNMVKKNLADGLGISVLLYWPWWKISLVYYLDWILFNWVGLCKINFREEKWQVKNGTYFVSKIILTFCQKKSFSDREKLLKFTVEGLEFAKIY